MLVFVRDNNVEQALKALKKKMQREGMFREMKRRKAYEKPSEKKAREKGEAIRRSRKAARKLAQREGLLPMPKRKVPRGRAALAPLDFRRARRRWTQHAQVQGRPEGAFLRRQHRARRRRHLQDRRQLPEENGDQQYRIQSADGPRERVAKESQLSAVETL